MAEILLMFIIIIIIAPFVMFVNNKDDKEFEEKKQELFDFLDKSGSKFCYQKIEQICGVYFLMYKNIYAEIVTHELSEEHERFLVETHVLKENEDIRTFNEEETKKVLLRWYAVYMTFLKGNKIVKTEEDAIKLLLKWQKVMPVISKITNEYLEKCDKVQDLVLRPLIDKKDFSGQSWFNALERLKTTIGNIQKDFEKELQKLKDKNLFILDDNQN